MGALQLPNLTQNVVGQTHPKLRKHDLQLVAQREHSRHHRLVTASSLASLRLSNMFASDDKKRLIVICSNICP